MGRIILTNVNPEAMRVAEDWLRDHGVTPEISNWFTAHYTHVNGDSYGRWIPGQCYLSEKGRLLSREETIRINSDPEYLALVEAINS